MIVFTVTLRLSDDLPDSFRHNVWGSVHLGDFILPMFLFASGLSLAYFLHKSEKEKDLIFLQKVIKRFIKLSFVGISLSFFSAYGFLQMDEVMLCAILFIICVVLSRLDWKIMIGMIFIINLSYLFLIQFNKINIFEGNYLGGYPAAIYYLPVMLTGLMIGKNIVYENFLCEKNKIIIIIIFIFFIIFRIFIPINKMTASPTFIMLSILFSLICFAIIDILMNNKSQISKLEIIGKTPLQYWVMMYIVFIIPLWFYVTITKQNFPLKIFWPISIFISFGLIFLIFGIFYFLKNTNIN